MLVVVRRLLATVTVAIFMDASTLRIIAVAVSKLVVQMERYTAGKQQVRCEPAGENGSLHGTLHGASE